MAWTRALRGIILLSSCLLPAVGAQIYECPDDWETFGSKCYRFVLYPELIHDAARAHCGDDGASLVGVQTEAEHVFISTWLLSNDLSRREFSTSGLVRNLAEGDLVWESDGSAVSPNLQYWLSEADKHKQGQYITYKYGVTTYGWSRALSGSELPFICEIGQDEAYRITDEQRDFDYGLTEDDPNTVPRGPKFVQQPADTLLVSHTSSATVQCAVSSNPSSVYRMYRAQSYSQEVTLITADFDPRYSLTNGMLTIRDPTQTADAGDYFCDATNPSGTVLSHSGALSFGTLGEFSNVERDKVRVVEHSYGVIDCAPPNFHPAVAFGWMKSTPGNFLRTDLMTHLFVSYNGKLYFSEVGISDAAVYYCVVKLTPLRGSAEAPGQPPSRVSLPLEMEVTHGLPKYWGPEIANDFIAVFPGQPLRGQRIRMECLAYGTMPIYYEWRREGLPLPLTATLAEENRVLEIDDVQLEDSGKYVCRASRGTTNTGGASQEKTYTLTVQAVPYFIFDLHDQHVDEGRKLTWRCEARGLPNPKYAWLKNGVVLTSIAGDVEISANVLTILAPDAVRHSGMYQCRASNSHGASYSTGQLRVLGFAPTFAKRPLLSTTMGALGGTTTILCSPEAAPTPTITWLKNGAGVGSPDVGSRVRVLSNGNLVISDLQTADEGTYTCQAENSYGAESSSGLLEVLARTTISNPPSNTFVRINNTAFLSCQASHDPALDLEAEWFFQGRPLNWRDLHYRKGETGGIAGLYIQGAQKKHNGRYSCRARTTFDTVMANATLTVTGPPGEPGGLVVYTGRVTEVGSVALRWTPGALWGGVITHYTVQASTDYNRSWFILKDNIPESSTIGDVLGRRETVVTGLQPWTSYRFRLRARNVFGNGPFSVPTGFHQTLTAAPVRAPVNVSAGNGKVGDLNITWIPLSPEEHGAPGFGYNVFFRLHNRPNDNWVKATLGDVRSYVYLVGQEFYYTLYDVKVQPFNAVGPGPNSSVATVYSAEDLPLGTPTNVRIVRHNATALKIEWIPVEDTRAVMRGRIVGYQINYWEDVSDRQILSHYTGKPASGALIIGLLADTWYGMDVQVYNSAGLGPLSEQYRQRTWNNEIKSQPTEVMVRSHGADSVYVTWRGVSSQPNEESLLGYVMQYWPATDNIRTAQGEFVGKQSHGVISGLVKNVVYKLRVYPYSRGGDGGSSPDRLFTLGGQIYFDPATTEIFAKGARLSSSVCVVLVAAWLCHVLS